MRLEDWREWSSDALGPLLERERLRWRAELGWDTARLFGFIEQARASGQLPGLVAVEDNGALSGWCYAAVQEGTLFIGALHGNRTDIIRQLLDTMLAAPEAAHAREYRCFVFPQSPAVAAALARRRFEIQPFLYLSRPLNRPQGETGPGRDSGARHPASRLWTLDDLPETARLLARAYAGSSDARCFAPGGRLDEWAAYLAQLVRTPGCGDWAPGESFAHRSDDIPGRIDGVIVATRMSGETSHVAQIAVDPALRGRGIAAALVEASASEAMRTGAARQTLLVAETNGPARALYARLGFTHCSSFLYADRPRVSRVSAAAVWPPDSSAAMA